jgi:hypothetical protein
MEFTSWKYLIPFKCYTCKLLENTCLGLKPPVYNTCSYKIDNFDYSYDKFMIIWFFYAGDSQIKEYIIANYQEVMNIITCLNRGRTVFFNRGNDDNLYQNICFDHV